jgi:hypothetical protein
MHYALFIYDNPTAIAAMSEAEQAAITREYIALRQDPAFVDGAALHGPEASSPLRVADGERLVTDGPFAATKDVVGGYYVVAADDLDGALAFAARIPAARLGGAVEIRPLVDVSAYAS